jgi:hypothetical protein
MQPPPPNLYTCDQSRNSCLPKLKAGKLPKFFIANGNWVGQLPRELQSMSFGSLSLMRPVKSYGRVTTFQGTSGPGGSSLKGHVYSTPLPTAIVTQKVPIQPSNSVVRVLVVSPFTSEALALNKGKIASTRSEYIIRCLSCRPRGIAETTGQRHRKQESFPQQNFCEWRRFLTSVSRRRKGIHYDLL